MSKPKKNQKKTPQAKAAAAAVKKKEKKKIDPKVIKTVLITLAAVIGVAAIVLLAIFVIKPAIEKNKAEKPDKTTTTSKVYEQGDEFLQIEYNGLSIPAVFADLIKEAEAERDAKCSKYGVALEVGGMKIPRPEFNMYYYDQYMEKYFDVQKSLQDNGQNMTGFDPEQAPENQKYIRGSGTWADYFSFEATSEIQKLYADFERACKAGTVLSSEGMRSLIASYDQVINGASKKGFGTTDEYMEDMYFSGVDFSMFFARVIMDAYAGQFRIDEKERLEGTVTEKELAEKYDEDPKKFQVAKVRVYMIEGEYNAAEAAAVRNKEEFIAYAKNNHPYETFDVELNTNLGWIAYTDLEAYHGETVANWAFDSSRVTGEIGVVEDFLARYMIYIEEPAFDAHTYQLLCYRNQHADPNDHEPALALAKEFNAEWEKSAKSEENFRNLAEKTGYLTEDAAIITRYDLDMAEWFADPARKPGDTKLFDASDAAYVVYFVGKNTEDILWKKDVRKTLAAEKFEEEFKKLAAKDYEPEFNETQLKQSYKDAKARVDRYIKANTK